MLKIEPMLLFDKQVTHRFYYGNTYLIIGLVLFILLLVVPMGLFFVLQYSIGKSF